MGTTCSKKKNLIKRPDLKAKGKNNRNVLCSLTVSKLSNANHWILNGNQRFKKSAGKTRKENIALTKTGCDIQVMQFSIMAHLKSVTAQSTIIMYYEKKTASKCKKRRYLTRTDPSNKVSLNLTLFVQAFNSQKNMCTAIIKNSRKSLSRC